MSGGKVASSVTEGVVRQRAQSRSSGMCSTEIEALAAMRMGPGDAQASETQPAPVRVVQHNFVMVPGFREPALEATYQEHVRESKRTTDGTWLLLAAVVDVVIFWKFRIPTQLGFDWPLGVFTAVSMGMVYLHFCRPLLYVKHRTLLLVSYKVARAALHLMPRLVLWINTNRRLTHPLVLASSAVWNLIFGSKASLLMYQASGGQVSWVVDLSMSVVLLCTSLRMTPQNCASCAAHGDVNGWIQSLNKGLSWIVLLLSGAPIDVAAPRTPPRLELDCLLLMAFCEMSLGTALPLCVQYYQAATGRARYAITHKLRPLHQLRAEANLQSYSLLCWLAAAWIACSLLTWRVLQAVIYADV